MTDNTLPVEVLLESGQTLIIERDETYPKLPFVVTMWNADGECHWQRHFATEEEARKEYNRWRDY